MTKEARITKFKEPRHDSTCAPPALYWCLVIHHHHPFVILEAPDVKILHQSPNRPIGDSIIMSSLASSRWWACLWRQFPEGRSS